MADITLKAEYDRMANDRSDILDRAIECAELTIPSLLTDVDHKESDTLTTPYQSLGSRSVNNLASKLLLALLPPNTPFFKFVPDKIEMALTEEENPEAAQEIKDSLVQLENVITNSIEKQGIRINAFQLFKLLIATGNSLVYKQPDKGIKVYDLSQYVVKRSGDGSLLKIIIKEQTNKTHLPEEVQSQIKDEDPYRQYDIYTGVMLNSEGKFDVWQEAEEIKIGETEGKYDEESLPWLALRWTSVSNEDYGRGLVEQYLGDLRSLEGLTQAIVEGAAASSKVLFMVNPMGNTKAKDIAKASNGDIIQGNAAEVTTLQVQKAHDMTIAYNTQNDIQRRLAAAFLLTESARRDSERTTAYEIQLMASELEDALGGIYSILTLEFQQPLVRLLMDENKVKLDSKLVKPIIVSGLDALSRLHDFNKLNTFSQSIQSILGPEIFNEHANVDVFIQRLADSLNIDSEGLIKSKNQIAEDNQQKALQQADEQALNSMGAAGGQLMAEGIAQQSQEQRDGEE